MGNAREVRWRRSARRRLAGLLAVALACSGCDASWIQAILAALLGGDPGDPITLTPAPGAVQAGTGYVSDDKLQDLLDLTVRFSLVQDRAAPQYTIAEQLAVGGRHACGVDEPGTVPADLAQLGGSEVTAVDYENPLMNTGLFLAVLALRDHAHPRAEERQLMLGVLRRLLALGRRTGEPGYFLRYDGQHAWSADAPGAPDAEQACAFPDGYCTRIDQGPYADGAAKYAVNNIPRHWEPSADEIVGLVTGLSFAWHYSGDTEVKAAAKAVAADLAAYLRRHRYFLERPCPDGGIVWRGGHLTSYSWPFERIFSSMGLGSEEPAFLDPLSFCLQDQLVARPFSVLLPCSPIMRDNDDTELAAMVDAVQLPLVKDGKQRFDLWTDGAQFPLLKITSSGLNLAALVFLALKPVDGDGRLGAQYQQWYRNIQAAHPEQVTPLWAAVLAFHGRPLTTADLPALDALTDEAAFPAGALPEDAPGRNRDVTAGYLLPVFLLGAAQGHVVDRAIRPEALPLPGR